MNHMQEQNWKDECGITSSSFLHQIGPGKGPMTIMDLPKIARDELGMRILDINTNSLGSIEPDHAERLRAEVDRTGCIVTNIKLNQRDIDMNHADPAERERALAVYRKSVDAAAILGARWVRPLPPDEKPDMQIHIDGYRALADYAATNDIQVIVEEYGWMRGDPDSVPTLIDAVDRGLAASPDTGSWDDDARYEGLARCFPLAVTCDYKAFVLSADGEHTDYDLRRCWQLGRDTGFRGPWCFEHWNESLPDLLRELRMLKDMIGSWSATDE
jgi:hypothetical protein